MKFHNFNSKIVKKTKNVEVDKRNLLNSISIFGLKLERILTLLYKKKKDSEFESINTVFIQIFNKISIKFSKKYGVYSVPPDFIGLNTRIYADMEEKELKELNDNELINLSKILKIHQIFNTKNKTRRL